MNEVYVLEQAQELVRTGWCVGAAAKDSRGRAVEIYSREAGDWAPCQFDMCGAVMRICTVPGDDKRTEDLFPVAWKALDYLAQAVRELHGWDMSEEPFWHILHEFNDSPGRAKNEVVAVFTKSIELARMDV